MLQQAFKNQDFSRLLYFEIQLPSLQSKKNEEVSAYAYMLISSLNL